MPFVKTKTTIKAGSLSTYLEPAKSNGGLK